MMRTSTTNKIHSQLLEKQPNEGTASVRTDLQSTLMTCLRVMNLALKELSVVIRIFSTRTEHSLLFFKTQFVVQ